EYSNCHRCIYSDRLCNRIHYGRHIKRHEHGRLMEKPASIEGNVGFILLSRTDPTAYQPTADNILTIKVINDKICNTLCWASGMIWSFIGGSNLIVSLKCVS